MSQKKYWCFICEAQFQVISLQPIKQCPLCHEQAFEEQTASSNPSEFQIYSKPSENGSPTSSQPTTVRPAQISILSMFSNMSSTNNSNNQQNLPSETHTINIVMNNAFQLSNALINSLPPEIMSMMDVMIGNLVNSGRSYRPATPQEINALEKVDNPKQCGICQAEEGFESNEAQNKGWKLKCGHQFHECCLKPWISKANTCPMCRNTI